MSTNNTIRLKKRAAGGAAGAPSSLASGEPAYNEQDNTLYYGYGDNGSGVATSVISIAGRGAFADLTTAQTIGGVKTFSNSPQAPTPTTGDNSTNVATTAFVQTAVGAAGGLQAPNTVYAGPATGGSSAAPTFRALTAADMPAAVLGGLSYQGTLSASSASLPSSPSKGQYWVISTAGTFTGTTHAFKVGDWLVANGSASVGDVANGFDFVDNSVQVSSVFGRTGAIVANTGDYTSDQVTEGTSNLYFTVARVLAAALTGLSTATNSVVSATDSILVAIGKLQAQVTARLVASNNLSDLTNTATAQINLGLGSMATQNASAVAITGGTISGTTITGGTF